jgi:hypothetical protein
MHNQTSQRVVSSGNTPLSAGIPDGFVQVLGDDGGLRIVPEYLIPATDRAFDGYRKRVQLDVRNEEGGVRIDFNPLGIFSAVVTHAVPLGLTPTLFPMPMSFISVADFMISMPDQFFIHAANIYTVHLVQK